MKIQTLLEQFELLYENFNITQMTVEQMGVVRRFIQNLVYEQLPERENPSALVIAGIIDQLRKPDVRVAIKAVGEGGYEAYDAAMKTRAEPEKSDRSQQLSIDAPSRSEPSRAYGFGPDSERDIKLVRKSAGGRRSFKERRTILRVANALESVNAYDVENTSITDRGILSLISALLNAASKTAISELADTQTFNKYAERLLHKRQSEIVSASEAPDSVRKARELDLNAFVFLISMKRRQARQKESWSNYLNPVAVTLFKQTMNEDLDYEAASDALINAGFIKRADSGYMPNWDEIESFQDELLESITNALNLAKEHGMRITQGGARGITKKEEAFRNMVNTIQRFVPNELVKLAERNVISIMKDLTSEESGTKSVVNSFLASADTLQDLPQKNRIHIFIKNNITLSTIKVVASMIMAMGKGSSSLDVSAMVRRDMRPMLQNLGKQMRAPR